jgi:hypothetical protein
MRWWTSWALSATSMPRGMRVTCTRHGMHVANGAWVGRKTPEHLFGGGDHDENEEDIHYLIGMSFGWETRTMRRKFVEHLPSLGLSI